ncbi:MAG TPA: FmdE family protein [Anaerolineae bacterium]
MKIQRFSPVARGTVPSREILLPLLELSVTRHEQLCPRQVLGVRIGLYGLRALGLVDEAYWPRFRNLDKRLLTIVETDGCGADGIAVATDCHIGRRTLRVVDYGKVAATLVDIATNRAIRVAPSPKARNLAPVCAPDATSRWHAYLEGYQVMADEQLLRLQVVQLRQPVTTIISRPNARVICEQCGEEIMNEREVVCNDRILCQSCAGDSYYESQ